MTESLTSTQNPKIKRLVALREKSSARREEGVFLVEGLREAEHCLEGGFSIRSIYFCPEICAKEDVLALAKNTPAQFEVSREVYEKIACRESTEGVIAEVRCHNLSLGDLKLGENPLIAVLESVEKPGNLGAVLRSADAAGVDAVIFCDPLTDLWNPNLIRASLGAVFTVPTVCCSSEQAISFLKERGIRILTAQLQDSSLYYDCDMRGGTAIVMGTESTGLSQQWRQAADAHIRIPMLGRLDSLNVSVSAAILLFEALRQRKS